MSRAVAPYGAGPAARDPVSRDSVAAQAESVALGSYHVVPDCVVKEKDVVSSVRLDVDQVGIRAALDTSVCVNNVYGVQGEFVPNQKILVLQILTAARESFALEVSVGLALQGLVHPEKIAVRGGNVLWDSVFCCKRFYFLNW